jgi:UDP-N-acetylglucosamine:LPS N-acetylglucosamine transferase
VLYRTACELLADPERCERMERAQREVAVVDAAERIYQTIVSLCH